MKEFEPHKKTGTEVIQKVKQEYKLVGSHKKVRGLKVWSYNVSTDEIKEVVTQSQVAVTGITNNLNTKETHKAIFNPDCIYFNALNKKNAFRKAVKIMSKKIDFYEKNRIK